MRFHTQNLTDGKLPLWRHGRGWFGPYRLEWSTFDWKLGCTLHTKRSEGWTLCLHFLLGSLYLRFREGSFFGYSYGIDWRREDWTICIDVGTNDSEWRRDFPWYRKGIRIPLKELVCGRAKCETVKGDPVDCLVPMPEGAYRAKAIPETRTWTYRFGVKRVRESWWLDIERGGIPFQGKGENSWDCGDDGLCGIGGETLNEAIGNAVRSALDRRRRYGQTSETHGRVVYARPEVANG